MGQSKRNKNVHYVLRKGLTPGIYDSYDKALSHKFPWDDRPVIRGFRTREEAEYYFKHGVEMPINERKEEPKGRPLFTDDDLERGVKENIKKDETDENPYAGL